MSTEKGRKAEDKATRYLALRGYHIIERNALMGREEIDIIAIRKHILTYVYVKRLPTKTA